MADHKNSFILIFVIIFIVILAVVFVSNSLISKEIEVSEKGESASFIPQVAETIIEKSKKEPQPYEMMKEPATQLNPSSAASASPMTSQAEPKKIHEIPLDDVILVE